MTDASLTANAQSNRLVIKGFMGFGDWEPMNYDLAVEAGLEHCDLA